MKGALNRSTLIALLAIQLAIVGAMIAVKSGSTAQPEPFLSFDAAAIDALSVSGEDGAVELSKADEAWRLPSGLPADSAKVGEVIDKLADADARWPVATSASVQERFEVAAENHQRRVKLSVGGEVVADIYLGTSPGYGKSHARRVDDDDIHAISFSNYEAGMKAGDWLDKSLLRPSGALAGLRYEGVFDLKKNEDDVWVAASGEPVDPAKVETFAARFTGLTVTGVSELAPAEALAEAERKVAQAAMMDAAEGDEEADELVDDEPEEEPKTPSRMVFALVDEDGTQTLTVHRIDASDYLATSDRVTGTYKMSSYIAEQMHKSLADFAPDESEAPDDPALSDGGDPESTPYITTDSDLNVLKESMSSGGDGSESASAEDSPPE